jgi:hypothetical protein
MECESRAAAAGERRERIGDTLRRVRGLAKWLESCSSLSCFGAMLFSTRPALAGAAAAGPPLDSEATRLAALAARACESRTQAAMSKTARCAAAGSKPRGSVRSPARSERCRSLHRVRTAAAAAAVDVTTTCGPGTKAVDPCSTLDGLTGPPEYKMLRDAASSCAAAAAR